ncbi:hypothetical protein [Micromonospora craniellae]|uniref:hypothetical protein n=1 Tax=Micromonospora craniellae TaxID=2294034 RepID=UPI001313E82A|nr:hypothetical protein [Micromonospora craniellae]QOC89861.1 hypothetical protein ID554_16620 [Micromonospora craniellae]
MIPDELAAELLHERYGPSPRLPRPASPHPAARALAARAAAAVDQPRPARRRRHLSVVDGEPETHGGGMTPYAISRPSRGAALR